MHEQLDWLIEQVPAFVSVSVGDSHALKCFAAVLTFLHLFHQDILINIFQPVKLACGHLLSLSVLWFNFDYKDVNPSSRTLKLLSLTVSPQLNKANMTYLHIHRGTWWSCSCDESRSSAPSLLAQCLVSTSSWGKSLSLYLLYLSVAFWLSLSTDVPQL